MNDTVYRQDAIDALKAAYWDNDIQSAKDDPCIVDAMTDWAIRQLKALPSAQQWIPVSERLPEKSGRYLVTRGLNACGALWNRVYFINYSDLMGLKSDRIWWDGNVGKSDFERIDDVIAWMPLPKPWKGDTDE